MSTVRGVATLTIGAALVLGTVAGPASAEVDRQVILIVPPGMSYEEALDDPLLTGLARSGGIALMTTSGDTQHRAQAAISLGAGRSAAAAPRGPARFAETG